MRLRAFDARPARGRTGSCLVGIVFLISMGLYSGAFGAIQTATYSAKLNASGLQLNQTAVVAVVVDIAPGSHAQSHQPLEPSLIPLTVAMDANPTVDFLDPIYPPAEIETFLGLGPQSIYTHRVIVYVPLRVKSDATVGDITLSGKLTWQACNDQVCFMPKRNQPFSIQTQIVSPTSAVTPTDVDLFTGFDASIFAKSAPAAAAAPVPLASASVDFFGHSFDLAVSNVPLAMSIALVVGILFNLMPCVLPVVPLKAIGFFEVSRHNRARCLMLGTIFSIGVISVFVVLGLLIVVLRDFSWGEEFRYGWFVWSMVAILVLMAIGMFGWFEIVLPQSVYSITPNHESIPGNLLFGMLTAVLSTPCTAPMFVGIMAWAFKQPKILGMLAIVMVGVGMALPYFVLSAFPNLARKVPRTGPWSAVLKQMMGFLILAVAVYFAGGRLASSREFFWAVFAVIAAAMLFLVIRTIQLSGRVTPIFFSLASAAAVIAISISITLRMTGGLDWKPFSPQAFSDARASGKPVLVEFTANWCANCLALEGSVFHDPRTAAAVEKGDVILLRGRFDQHRRPRMGHGQSTQSRRGNSADRHLRPHQRHRAGETHQLVHNTKSIGCAATRNGILIGWAGDSENVLDQIPPALKHISTLKSRDHGRDDSEQAEHRNIFHRRAAASIGQESSELFHNTNIFGFIGALVNLHCAPPVL